MNMKTLRQDLPAGLVVFLVALPLCLGIAQASGLPPFVGLLTGVIGGLVVTSLVPRALPSAARPPVWLPSWWPPSRRWDPSPPLFALVLAGIIQFILGMLRAGRFIALVPCSVIKGMLAAIGILLIMQQIPVALAPAATAS